MPVMMMAMEHEDLDLHWPESVERFLEGRPLLRLAAAHLGIVAALLGELPEQPSGEV